MNNYTLSIKRIAHLFRVMELVKPPLTPAGWLLITDNFKVSSTNKPNAFHRLMVCLLLGWRWKDKQ